MAIAHLVLRYAHISAGMLSLVSGAAAMTFAKGSRLHRLSGNAFFVSMLTLSLTGLVIALFISPNKGNVMGGSMAFYLVATAWVTVMRQPGQTGRFEIAGALVGFAIAATGITFGIQAANSPDGRLDQYAPPLYLIFASVALLCAAMDVRMIVRGGVTGVVRTSRHLTRMGLAFYMATGSFFLGQARLFPAEVRESGLLPIPAFLPIGLLLFWLIRVRVWPLITKAWAPRIARHSV